jgi:hypothetical protein
MQACKQDELGALIISVAAFGILAFGLHLLATYLLQGSLLFSALTAGVQTLFAIVIFLSLHRLLDVVKTVVAGLVLYTAVFVALYSYVWVPQSFTVKINNAYVFRDGSVTLHGILKNFEIAVVGAALSSLAFVVCSWLGLLCGTQSAPAHHEN